MSEHPNPPDTSAKSSNRTYIILAIIAVVAFVFFFFHALLYWVLERALLGQAIQLEPVQVLVMAILNAIVAVFLYQFLDRLRITG